MVVIYFNSNINRVFIKKRKKGMKRMFKKSLAMLLVVFMVAAVFAGCQSEPAKEAPQEGKEAPAEETKTSNFPTKKTVEIVAPASPGGGWDSTARAIQKVIKDNDLAPDVNVIVTNKPGGKGSIAWNMLIDRADSHQVAMDSAYIYLNKLLGVEGAQDLEDLQPIATLTSEWIAVFVKADSEFQNINEVMDKLKEDPNSLKIAVAPGKGNNDHLSFLKTAKTAGVDIVELDKNIMATTTGELIPGLLGGFYDVVSVGANEGLEFMKSGDLRAISITADERLEGDFADVPTLKEQGIDVVYPHWRGILAHPEMTDEEIAWWDDLLGKVVATDDWQQILENNSWLSYYKNSEETAKMWEEEYESYEELVNDVGLGQ